jgi:L-ascorbate metabolism protein UlaG (beta-lactamase superfamily)
MQPRETWSSDGLVVRATGSTDQGVGFLVTVDGLTLYHAGDHARWAESDDQAFMAEIQWLKNVGPPIPGGQDAL